jgi:hypothetical protein
LVMMAAGCAGERAAQAPVEVGKAEAWVRTEIFIGLSKEGGGHVNRWEWAGFEGELGRDFPAGFTVMDGRGAWAGPGGRLVREGSRVVIVCYPKAEAGKMEAAVEKACAEAVRRLGQVEVMRVDAAAEVSFVRRMGREPVPTTAPQTWRSR